MWGGCDLETVPLCCWRFASCFPWAHRRVPLGCGVRPTPPGGARGDGDSPPQVFTRPLSSAGSRRCIPVLPDHLRPITAGPTLTHLRDTHALISWIDQGIEGSRAVPGCPSPRAWHSPITRGCTAPAAAAGDRLAPKPPSPPPSARRGAARRGRGDPWRPGWWRCLPNRSFAVPCGSWRWA